MAAHSGVIRTKPKEITDLLKEIRGKWKYSTFGWNEEKYYHNTWYDQAREEVRNCLGYLANGDNQGLRRSDEKLDFPKFEYDKIKTELKSLLSEAGTGKNEAGTDKVYDRPYKLPSFQMSGSPKGHLNFDAPKLSKVLVILCMIKIGIRLFNHTSQGYYSATKYVNLQESSGFKLVQAQILAAIDHSWKSMSTSEQVSLKQELMGIAHGDGENWKTLGELKEVLRAKARSVGEASSLGNAHVPSSSSTLARLLHNAGFASTSPHQTPTQLSLRKGNLYFPSRR